MAGYDLICTWGSGALDVALAHTLFADVYKLPPLVHHEGEGDVERSTLARRIAFGRTAALVVPTKPMEQRALEKWQQPRHRVRLIPQGIDAARYAIPPKRDGVPGIIKRRGESWLGTFATPQQAAPLIKLVTELPEEWRLVVATPQGGHEAILSEASRHGVDDRVHPVTPPSDIARLVSLFDLFVSPHSDTAALEAVAAGLPAIVARDGEAAAWVASENGPFLCSPGDEKELASAISKLAGDRTLRRRIGEANRQKALAEFDEAQMIERIRALYRSLIGPR